MANQSYLHVLILGHAGFDLDVPVMLRKYISRHWFIYDCFPRVRLLQTRLDYNRDYHIVGVRLSMSRPTETAFEPACQNDSDDVTFKTRRVSRRHHLQPERLQVSLSVNTLYYVDESEVSLSFTHQHSMLYMMKERYIYQHFILTSTTVIQKDKV